MLRKSSSCTPLNNRSLSPSPGDISENEDEYESRRATQKLCDSTDTLMLEDLARRLRELPLKPQQGQSQRANTSRGMYRYGSIMRDDVLPLEIDESPREQRQMFEILFKRVDVPQEHEEGIFHFESDDSQDEGEKDTEES